MAQGEKNIWAVGVCVDSECVFRRELKGFFELRVHSGQLFWKIVISRQEFIKSRPDVHKRYYSRMYSIDESNIYLISAINALPPQDQR